MTVSLVVGDVFERLRAVPDQHFDSAVFSPPYWGLRKYIEDGAPEKKYEIGLEPTLGEHLAVIVAVMREVRRVLKMHGTVWLNYGDCYAAKPNTKSAAAYKADGSDDRTFRDKPFSTVGPIYVPGFEKTDRVGQGNNRGNVSAAHGGRIVAGGYLKPKDLCMIPNRLAIALQDDGWYVRSEIIWHKPNPMPESVYDRPTTAHEKIWLLTRSEDYYYNHEAIREPVSGGTHARRAKAPGPNSRQHVDRVPVARKAQGPITRMDGARIQADKRKIPNGWDTEPGTHGAFHREGRGAGKTVPIRNGVKNNASFNAAMVDVLPTDTRNARNVWTIAPKPFREAHFATFPPELAAICIKAGTPPTTCGCCGAVGECGGICASFPRVPGRVLDPFGGAGTVGLVAEQLGLDSTLIELSPEYADIARRRIGEAAFHPQPEGQAA